MKIFRSTPQKQAIFMTFFWFLASNGLGSLLLGYQYILHSAGTVEGLYDRLYLHVMLISNFALLYLVLSLVLAAVLAIFPRRGIFFLLVIPTVVLLHLATFIDVTIFRIFKFHINSMVLNLFLTEGAWDSVHIGWPTLLTAFGVVAALIVGEVLLFFWLSRWCSATGSSMRRSFFRARAVPLILAFCLTMIVADKLIYSVADFYNDCSILRYEKMLPLYPRITMKRFLRKYFHAELDREHALEFNPAESPLDYPKAPLQRKPRSAYPNIVWLVLDAWRFDMLRQEVCPNIWDFSQKALVFTHHYSGGNASRFGIFSLFYGVYAYYWHQFLGARQSTVFIDELRELGYDFRILSSTRLTYPEFRKTAFITIPDAIDDRMTGTCAAEKDPQTARHFLDWLSHRDSEKPFFSFLFFDAPHGPYSYPDEFDKFVPSRKTANYVTVDKNDMLPLKNSYKNAIYFNDALVGKILSSLERAKLLEKTIVVITADHGEEFYESGFLGHTSAFSQQQTNVPFILYLPGVAHREIDRLTSHLDVVPTMLERLGYTSPPEIYSHGVSLLDEQQARTSLVSCGWDDCAVIDPTYSIVFSTETYNSYFFEIRDAKYRLISEYQPILNQKYAELMQVLEDFRRFNK